MLTILMLKRAVFINRVVLLLFWQWLKQNIAEKKFFQSQMISSQSEERTMVSTREKDDTSNKNHEDVFSRVRKMIRPIISHGGV